MGPRHRRRVRPHDAWGAHRFRRFLLPTILGPDNAHLLAEDHALSCHEARFAATSPGHNEPVSRFYRLDPDGLCSTLRAGTGYERGSFCSRPIHPSHPRVISVREAARLQSFPIRFGSTAPSGSFRQVGNALPPILARQLGGAIVRALGAKPVRPRRTVSVGDVASLTWGMQEAVAQLGVADLRGLVTETAYGRGRRSRRTKRSNSRRDAYVDRSCPDGDIVARSGSLVRKSAFLERSAVQGR